MTNLSGIQPIYFVYYIHDHNFKDTMIFQPKIEYIPLYYVIAIGDDEEQPEIEIKHNELSNLNYISKAI